MPNLMKSSVSTYQFATVVGLALGLLLGERCAGAGQSAFANRERALLDSVARFTQREVFRHRRDSALADSIAGLRATVSRTTKLVTSYRFRADSLITTVYNRTDSVLVIDTVALDSAVALYHAESDSLRSALRVQAHALGVAYTRIALRDTTIRDLLEQRNAALTLTRDALKQAGRRWFIVMGPSYAGTAEGFRPALALTLGYRLF